MAQKCDWIVGLSRKRDANKVIYAMRVTEEPLIFEQYFSDKRFERKKPDLRSRNYRLWCGDNIYRPRRNGDFEQISSLFHSNVDGSEHLGEKRKDLSGLHVLVSRDFYYFGGDPRPLPRNLRALRVGRGHKCKFSEQTIAKFEAFIRKQIRGVNTEPADFQEIVQLKFASDATLSRRKRGCKTPGSPRSHGKCRRS
jgi:hypothetical protein